MNDSNKEKLKAVLIANGLFSLTSGIISIFFPETLINILENGNTLLFHIIGGGLIIFALSVLYQAFQKEINTNQVKLIIYQDFAWVLGSLTLIGSQHYTISLPGQLLIAFIAIIVGVFGFLQKKFNQ